VLDLFVHDTYGDFTAFVNKHMTSHYEVNFVT